MKSEHRLIISPIGDFPIGITSAIAKETRRIFGFRVEFLPLLSDIDFAFEMSRNQYHSTAILEKLSSADLGDAAKILALTHVDLFIPILTYVYGEAQLGGKSCILSTYRLKEGLSPIDADARYISRITKEAIHELGHTFRLRHCKDPSCIMHYCRCISDVDYKSDLLCRYCAILLQDEINRLA